MRKVSILFLLFILLGAGCKDNSTNIDTNASAPSFESIQEKEISEAPVWLFSVADDDGNITLSTEGTDGTMKVAKFDPKNPDKKLSWKSIMTASEINGERVADHWHVFAHDAHWIVFSVAKANQSYLIKLNKNLEREFMVTVADNVELPVSEGVRMPNGETTVNLPTNDMFMVPDEDGVTVAHYYPDYGHRLFRMDTKGELIETKDIGGGEFKHGNGASALKVADGFWVFAPDSMNISEYSRARLLQYDKDWNPVKAITLVDRDKTHYGMMSAEILDNGYFVVHANVNEGVYAKGVRPPGPGKDAQNGVLADDGGDIVRFVFDENFSLVSEEKLSDSENSYRPHTEFVDDILYTTWDHKGSTLRMDTVVLE